MARKKSPASLERKKLREKRERADQEQTAQKQKNSFLASLLGCALSLYLYCFVYEFWLQRWYLVGPDTLYLRYGFSSAVVAFLTYPTYNYALRFRDGYEIDLTHLYAYCTGRNQREDLSMLVSSAFQD